MFVVLDLIRLDDILSDYGQHVETDLLETSTYQEATATQTGYASFNLPQKGFLHSKSKIFLSLIPAAGKGRSFYPQNIGVASLIQRAVLRVRKSGQVINDISDFGNFHSIKSTMVSNEVNKERNQYVDGRTMNHAFRHIRWTGAAIEDTGAESFGYGLDNGREYGVDPANAGRDGQNLNQLEFANMDGGAPTQSPTYSLTLDSLFPFLKSQQLPLFMIEQGLTVELFWSKTQLDRVSFGAGSTTGGDFLIDKNELKFCADYITYVQDDAMNRFRDANPVIDLTFPDYRLAKTTVTEADLASGIVRSLGMNNRLVSRALTILSREDAASGVDSDQGIVNKYNMIAPDDPTVNIATGATTGDVKYNLKYKSRFEFSQSLENKAEIFTELTKSEGLPFVTRSEYSREGGGYLVNTKFENKVQTTTLPGRFFIMGTQLSNGRVESDGIELHLSGDFPAGTYQVRTYLEYGRTARIVDGEMDVSNL